MKSLTLLFLLTIFSFQLASSQNVSLGNLCSETEFKVQKSMVEFLTSDTSKSILKCAECSTKESLIAFYNENYVFKKYKKEKRKEISDNFENTYFINSKLDSTSSTAFDKSLADFIETLNVQMLSKNKKRNTYPTYASHQKEIETIKNEAITNFKKLSEKELPRVSETKQPIENVDNSVDTETVEPVSKESNTTLYLVLSIIAILLSIVSLILLFLKTSKLEDRLNRHSNEIKEAKGERESSSQLISENLRKIKSNESQFNSSIEEIKENIESIKKNLQPRVKQTSQQTSLVNSAQPKPE